MTGRVLDFILQEMSTKWGPPVMLDGFINPMNIIVIGCYRYHCTINHSEIGVINAPTERNFVNGGPTSCIHVLFHDVLGHNPRLNSNQLRRNRRPFFSGELIIHGHPLVMTNSSPWLSHGP